jgi:hypothetical protein
MATWRTLGVKTSENNTFKDYTKTHFVYQTCSISLQCRRTSQTKEANHLSVTLQPLANGKLGHCNAVLLLTDVTTVSDTGRLPPSGMRRREDYHPLSDFRTGRATCTLSVENTLSHPRSCNAHIPDYTALRPLRIFPKDPEFHTHG